MKNEMTEKLYDYLGLGYDYIDLDFLHGFLTENYGRDGEWYWWYFDGFINAAINENTGEIISDDDKLEELFL